MGAKRVEPCNRRDGCHYIMKARTRVNLHCHSVFSDGELTPEALAEKLAAAGVAYASLTDHDTIDGLARFHGALTRHNVGFLSGVEISAQYRGREIHLLGYGFDVHHKELKATLQVLRHDRRSRIQGPLRRMPSQFQAPELEGEPAPGVAATGKIGIQEAIALVHRAGGLAFLAHPLNYESESEALTALVEDLQAMGLDGLEVTGDQVDEPERERLQALARGQGLLISAGTDLHSIGATDRSALGIDLPPESWKQFVQSMGSAAGPLPTGSKKLGTAETELQQEDTRERWSSFRPRIVLPSILAIVLFIVAIWGMILPFIENILVDRKRDMIRELTHTALSLLAAAEREERAGRITRGEAQEKAKVQIGALRYGNDGKDYFWIQDLQPRMMMHPYRSDLNDQDVSGFTDPRGVRIFVRFAQIVRRQEKGFVEYVWQWKDDPSRMEAKESYVCGFKPWNWVIGTGMYVDDVKREIKRIEQNLVYTLTGIVVLVFIVLLSNVRQSLDVEKKRLDMQANLQQAEERYRSLIEATTEGTLLVLDGRCRYGNPTLQQMTGYSAERLELLELSDLLPREPVNEEIWRHIENLAGGAGGSKSFEALLARADGEKRECIITLNPMSFADHPAIIVLAKDVYPSSPESGSVVKLGQVAYSASIGIFQANADRRGVIMAMNAAARALLWELCGDRAGQFAMEDLFGDPDAFGEFLKGFHRTGDPQDRMIQMLDAEGRPRMLSLSAAWIPEQSGKRASINCVIKDIGETVRREKEREALIEKLRVSLLFLQEPIGRLGGPAVACSLETPIHAAASLMVERDTTSIVVETTGGAPVGFLTDRDFRKRVAGNQETDLQMPVSAIMSAPLITISKQTMIYEALMLMEEKKVTHLAVEDGGGGIASVVRSRDLLQFHRYGPEVLPREIARAASAEQVVHCCRRLPALVKALIEAGARPRTVAYMLSGVCDAATSRFIELAVEELGPPPVPFAFIAMGSQGRQEQTLFTDQDNAIIYQENKAAGEAPAAFFLSLGERVCQWLNRAGYHLCDGEVMASNPVWCRSLPAWKETFAEWILKAEPKELLDLSICLDFRPVYGEAKLADELRTYICKALKDRPSFLPHLAQNALLFKPPLRLLGRIIKSGGPPEEAGKLNMKETLMPIIGFGRLYALRHKLPLTHSMERIEALVWEKALQPSACDAVSASYDFLMRLRFQAQLAGIRSGGAMDNCIDLDRIGHMDEAMLKQAYLQIESLQKKIGYDFLGGAEWLGH
jgi:PAS domain S-box-containing protein